MNILQTIIAHKQQEVALRKQQTPLAVLQQSPYYTREGLSLVHNLQQPDSTGIIAEFKRQSPSKGVINGQAKIEAVLPAYSQHAAGISILTDTHFFGGTNNDIQYNRSLATVPVLRKDFMIDSYQLHEAKAIGADVILLIAACLTPQQVQDLSTEAHDLGLQVLLEIHNEDELAHICNTVDMVGVNNRNLATFEVSLQTSLDLINKMPTDKPAIAESGIDNTESIVLLRRAGFSGFLIGEHFMKQPLPSIAFADFINQLKAEL
jgi:indole-3-glycerol phosphate synthase